MFGYRLKNKNERKKAYKLMIKDFKELAKLMRIIPIEMKKDLRSDIRKFKINIKKKYAKKNR